MLDGILWIMKTGAQWRDLPGRFGPWKTVYGRFRRWRAVGTLDRVVVHLQRDLDRLGLIDWSARCWRPSASAVIGAAPASGLSE